MGRTGVFITLSIVLERMRYEGVVDIFQTVKMLRTQRPAMVQTEVRGRNFMGIPHTHTLYHLPFFRLEVMECRSCTCNGVLYHAHLPQMV